MKKFLFLLYALFIMSTSAISQTYIHVPGHAVAMETTDCGYDEVYDDLSTGVTWETIVTEGKAQIYKDMGVGYYWDSDNDPVGGPVHATFICNCGNGKFAFVSQHDWRFYNASTGELDCEGACDQLDEPGVTLWDLFCDWWDNW